LACFAPLLATTTAVSARAGAIRPDVTELARPRCRVGTNAPGSGADRGGSRRGGGSRREREAARREAGRVAPGRRAREAARRSGSGGAARRPGSRPEDYTTAAARSP
jgi:hypothetical protein